MDTDCCKLCAENPLCDFWVRSTDNTNQCWLKNAFGGYLLNPPSASSSLHDSPPHCCEPHPGVECPFHRRCHHSSSLSHTQSMRGNFMGQAYGRSHLTLLRLKPT